MTLGLYVARRLLASFLLIAGVFFGVLLLFEVIEAMRRFGGRDIAFLNILWLAVLRVPRTLYQILPLISALASMAMFLGLARSSELVVIRAAGRSALRVMLEPVLAAILGGMLAVAVGNPIVSAANTLYQDRLAALNGVQTASVSVQDGAFWMRSGDEAGQTVIRARAVDEDGLGFGQVEFLIFSQEEGLPIRRIYAETARLSQGHWELTGVKIWDLQAANPELEAELRDEAALATSLTPEEISEGMDRAATVSIWDLPAFIQRLDAAGLNTRAQRAAFHAELALPLTLAAMTLVGAMFCLRHARTGTAGISVLLTVLAGFALFFFRNFAQVLGENGQIPLSLAIWAPPVAAILLALGVLLHLEDG